MKKHLTPEAVLMALLCCLAPIIGGQVVTEPRALYGGFFTELLGGGALPLTSRLLLGLLPIGAFALALRTRVVQIPNLRFLGFLTVFVGTLLFSVLLSPFKYVALREWLTYLTYATALVATVAVAGRVRNIKLFIGSILVGTAIVALKGIGEFVSVMATEPSHRIFADWNNPNSVASLFDIGAILSFGFAAAETSKVKWLGVATGALSVTGLVLTQSKGGFLAFGVGLVALLGFAAGFKQIKKAPLPILALCLGLLFAVGLNKAAQSQSQGGAVISRLVDAGSTAEQSAGFRENLWKTALVVAKEHPLGSGVGTFRYFSSVAGLTDQTVYAHENYLQILSEGGIVALLAFLGAAVVWLTLVVRGSRVQPPETLGLKAAVIAAVLTFGAHGLVESNISFFGTGVIFFVLLGLGLQLATDATSPEAMPSGIRAWVGVVFCLVPFVGMGVNSLTEIRKATVMSALEARDRDLVTSSTQGLRANAFGDPESLYLSTYDPTLSPKERADLLAQVAAQMPTPKYLRAAARQYDELGDPIRALSLLDEVKKYDPSNLPAGKLKLDILIRDHETDRAVQAANELIAMESSVSYKVRAIPELVPTETFEARLFLATQTPNADKKIELLQAALDGYVQYRNLTVQKLLAFRADMLKEPNATVTDQMVVFGSENLADAKKKLAEAQDAIAPLPGLYRQKGETDKADAAEKALESLAVND